VGGNCAMAREVDATVRDARSRKGVGVHVCGECTGVYWSAWAIERGTWACMLHEMQWLCDGARVSCPSHSLYVFMSLSTSFSRFRF